MKNALYRIFSLCVKELIGLFRDPFLVCLILYALSISIYLAAKAAPDAIDHASIAIVDEDKSALAKRLSDAFQPPLFATPVKIEPYEVDHLLDEGRYTFIIAFPAKFQKRVLAHHQPKIQINIDATRMNQAFAGNTYIQDILSKEIRNFMHGKTSAVTADAASFTIRNCFNQSLSKAGEGAVNDMGDNIALIALLLTGAALIRERERGTLEHLLATPVTPLEIMLSKIWAMMLVVLTMGLLSVIFIIHFLLGMPLLGSIWLFLAGLAVYLVSATAIGIFLACFARNMPQFGMLSLLVLLPMQVFSSASLQKKMMPPVIRWIVNFMPTTYFEDFCNAVLFRGADFGQIAPVFGKMLLLGILFFLIAWIRFRKTIIRQS